MLVNHDGFRIVCDWDAGDGYFEICCCSNIDIANDNGFYMLLKAASSPIRMRGGLSERSANGWIIRFAGFATRLD